MNKKTAVIGTILALGIVAVPTSAEASTATSKAINYGKAQMWEPYVLGGTGPNKWDCSGLVMQSFNKGAGKSLPRTAIQQYKSSKTAFVAAKNRKPGDLVFFGTKTSGTGDDHVGIYIGWKYKGKSGGWLLNANAGNYRGRQVVIAPIKEYGKVAGYRRVK